LVNQAAGRGEIPLAARRACKHASIFVESFSSILRVKIFSFHLRVHFFFVGALFYFFHFPCAITGNAQSASTSRENAESRAKASYAQGMAALQTGDLASARAAFEKVVRLAPQSPEGH